MEKEPWEFQREVKLLRIILPKWLYNIIFPVMINGKIWIDVTMSREYGDDWLDQVMDALRDREVCRQLANDLGLRKEDYLPGGKYYASVKNIS